MWQVSSKDVKYFLHDKSRRKTSRSWSLGLRDLFQSICLLQLVVLDTKNENTCAVVRLLKKDIEFFLHYNIDLGFSTTYVQLSIIVKLRRAK